LGEAQALVMQATVGGASEALLRSALSAFQAEHELLWEAATWRLLGREQARRGDQETARASFAEALRVAGVAGDDRELARVLRESARARLAQGQLEAAQEELETAILKSESLRAGVSSERLRATLLASVREIYDLYVQTLLERAAERPGEGFEALGLAAAERSRARALLDFLARSDVDASGDSPLAAEERRLRQELGSKAAVRVNRLRAAAEAEEIAALDREIARLTAEIRLAQERLRADDPRYAALHEPGIDLAGIRRLLGEDTALLEYSLGETGSRLFVVTWGSFQVFALPPRDRIEDLVERAQEALRNPGGAARGKNDLAELSGLLLAPALGGLEGKRIAVVPDGALRQLPFAALPVPLEEGGAVPLVLHHEVVYLPSAAVLREIRRAAARRPRPEGALAIFADPIYALDDSRLKSAARKPPTASTQVAALDLVTRAEPLQRLSWSRQEAERIAAVAGPHVLLALDFRANRELALSPELGRYRRLHFAAHGLLDAEHPDLSGLVLSQWDEQGRRRDGFLRLQDIYGLEIAADLVVLSGCETALGRRIAGEGLLGLTHGFLHAGASAVVASLWEVRDRATAELMERFYRALLVDQLPAASALRKAQLGMWEQRTWRDPYYWAAFTVQGDWQDPRP
jgi:CHAT domain-containing protein